MNTWLLLMTCVSANKETSFDTCSAVLLDMSGIRWQTSLFFTILFTISAQDGFSDAAGKLHQHRFQVRTVKNIQKTLKEFLCKLYFLFMTNLC